MSIYAQSVCAIPSLLGFRLEFYFFGLMLAGIAVFQKHTLKVALTGLIAILAFKLIFDNQFDIFRHFFGNHSVWQQIINKEQRQGEWSVLLNLFGLLVGFSILAKHFEESGIPDYLPRWLPDDWKGPFVLLILVFILSSFLDNIAAAMIGGTIAHVVFRRKVHIGYIAAIVAASNAGGSGSVIGDTTTTMMWIDGVNPQNVLHAYIAAISALFFFIFFASVQQDRFQKIQKTGAANVKIDFLRLLIVGMILFFTILTNVLFDFPAVGVWIAIITGSFFRQTSWKTAQSAVGGSIFLLILVTGASLMPVNQLPTASWQSALGLGFISSVFDNIPLTKLALDQGGYDWGMLAYAVGFGGSIIWFGSSAGVAITNEFPESKSVFAWLKNGWYIAVAYVLGFLVLLFVLGWNPHKPHKITSLIENKNISIQNRNI